MVMGVVVLVGLVLRYFDEVCLLSSLSSSWNQNKAYNHERRSTDNGYVSDLGREATFLRDRSDILRMRLAAVKSKQCRTKKNKYYCPEVFLDAVADKLSTTADLFLDAELLSKFYYSVCVLFYYLYLFCSLSPYALSLSQTNCI